MASDTLSLNVVITITGLAPASFSVSNLRVTLIDSPEPPRPRYNHDNHHYLIYSNAPLVKRTVRLNEKFHNHNYRCIWGKGTDNEGEKKHDDDDDDDDDDDNYHCLNGSVVVCINIDIVKRFFPSSYSRVGAILSSVKQRRWQVGLARQPGSAKVRPPRARVCRCRHVRSRKAGA